MKNSMKFVAMVAFLALTLTSVGFMQLSSQNFSIQNNTTENIGLVTINLQSAPAAYLPVPGPGTFSTQISSNAVSIVVNGVVVPHGAVVPVRMNDGRAVNVNFITASPIIDPSEQN